METWNKNLISCHESVWTFFVLYLLFTAREGEGYLFKTSVVNLIMWLWMYEVGNFYFNCLGYCLLGLLLKHLWYLSYADVLINSNKCFTVFCLSPISMIVLTALWRRRIIAPDIFSWWWWWWAPWTFHADHLGINLIAARIWNIIHSEVKFPVQLYVLAWWLISPPIIKKRGWRFCAAISRRYLKRIKTLEADCDTST